MYELFFAFSTGYGSVKLLKSITISQSYSEIQAVVFYSSPCIVPLQYSRDSVGTFLMMMISGHSLSLLSLGVGYQYYVQVGKHSRVWLSLLTDECVDNT